MEPESKCMYIIHCPGCHNDYVSKTDENLITRLSEHEEKKDQPMFQHFRFSLQLSRFFFSETRTVDHIEHVYNSVIDNYRILDSCNNWAIVQHLESYHIKTKLAMVNVGVKVSKDLQLFK